MSVCVFQLLEGGQCVQLSKDVGPHRTTADWWPAPPPHRLPGEPLFNHISYMYKSTSAIDLSTACTKWRFDGPALSGHLLYSLVNHAYANHHHLVR